MTDIQPGAHPGFVPGALPLPKPRHEAYCQNRALAYHPELAMVRAGFKPRSGMWGKLERKPEIAARIQYLRQVDDRLIAHQRARILEELNRILEFDITDYAVIDEETGQVTGIDWRKVRAAGVSKAVNEFNFDKDTGRLVRFRRDDRLGALAQLRDMFGFRAPSKQEHSGPDQGPIAVETAHLDDHQRLVGLMTILASASSKEDPS